MKTNRKHLANRQSGGLILNIGIGILLGLLAALTAVFLVMKGGPFKDNQNNNKLEQSGASIDPNAPLYGPNVPPLTNTPADTVVTDPKANTSATVETAQPVVTPSADPVAAIIDSTNKGSATKPTTSPQSTTPAPKEVKPVDPTEATTPTKPAIPKEVKPTTAPSTSASSQSKPKNGSYTIQAGAFNSASEAEAMRSKLAAQGQPVSISEKKTADGTLYLVRVGNYSSDKEAQAARSKVGGVVLEMGK